MNIKADEFLGSARSIGALILAAVLASCGGGGGGGGSGNSAPPVPLSADQKIFDNAELNDGNSVVNFNFPYGGGNLASGTNYIYQGAYTALAKSPSVGPQTQTPVYTSLDSALSLPTLGVTRYLAGGQVLVRSSTAMRQVSYVGSGVQFDYFADDGRTIVESVTYSNFSQVALTGVMENTSEEFQAIYPINDWITANNFSVTAKWQNGAGYIKRQSAIVGDTYFAQDCTNSDAAPTTTASTNPCLYNSTLDNFFPVTLYSGHPSETDFMTDGSIGIVGGVRMWVANQPLPTVQNNTKAYRVYYELNGNVYMGLLEKAGTSFVFQQTDDSRVNYSLVMNQAAINSIQQGLITGASVPGSEIGSTAEVPTIDLFGIGGHGINGALAPVDLQTHYAIPVTLTGAGQTIAIIDAPGSGNVADDLNTFSQYYNLPQCNSSNPCFQQVDLSNGAPIPAGDDWGGELELDTQMAHAVAPGAKIILVTAKSSNLSDILIAINYAAALPGVTAVTMSFSYGGSATDFQNEDLSLSAFQANQGIAFFASSGDDANSFLGTKYPASSPYVSAVGGTRINSVAWNPGGESEVAWQFSGGGISSYAPMPSWQLSYLGASVQAANGGFRAVPDVAAVADSQHSAVAIYYKQRWSLTGGTSVSSPIWAGISALLGQYLATEGKSLATLIKTTPGGFNGLVYQSKVTQGANAGFYDILSGSNNLTGVPCAICTAGPGYDEVTGWGAPNVSNLLLSF